MSDLDQFACAALRSILSDTHRTVSEGEVAKMAYDQAESMLREREKRLSGPEREELERLYREHMEHVVKGENLWPETVGNSEDGVTVTPVAECLEVRVNEKPAGLVIRHKDTWHGWRITGRDVLTRVVLGYRSGAIEAVTEAARLDARD